MNHDESFKEKFIDPKTEESIFGELDPMEMGDENNETEEGEGITAGTMQVVREKLKEYFVPEEYHTEVIDLIDEMMIGKHGKQLQEEAGFDDQLKMAISKVEERHGLSFDIEYDEED
ncbi:MAG TPA: hypothetical protein PK109_02955 [Candidatus Paceibacterota bacterium]|nr:hypothetical protein [Candidatus Paceibacterota bacterium]